MLTPFPLALSSFCLMKKKMAMERGAGPLLKFLSLLLIVSAWPWRKHS